MNFQLPRRIITIGAMAPSARYSPIASSWPPASLADAARGSVRRAIGPRGAAFAAREIDRSAEDRAARPTRDATRARTGRARGRSAARGSRLRRRSSCTRGRARPASRRDRLQDSTIVSSASRPPPALSIAPNCVVDIGDRAVIGAARVADLRSSAACASSRADVAQAPRMRVELGSAIADARHVDVLVAIESPVTRSGMAKGSCGWVSDTTRQNGRSSLPRARCRRALARGERHLVVEVELVGAHARTGLRSPSSCCDTSSGRSGGVIPVRRPAEIGGIDVGGQPLLEAVQLVGAAEMHLAGQHGAIARRAQIMGEGRDIRRESAALS